MFRNTRTRNIIEILNRQTIRIERIEACLKILRFEEFWPLDQAIYKDIRSIELNNIKSRIKLLENKIDLILQSINKEYKEPVKLDAILVPKGKV